MTEMGVSDTQARVEIPVNYHEWEDAEDDGDHREYEREYSEDDGDRSLSRNYHPEYEREYSEGDGDRPLTKNYDREYEREDSEDDSDPPLPVSYPSSRDAPHYRSPPTTWGGRYAEDTYAPARTGDIPQPTSDEMRGSYPHSRTSEYQPLP